MTETSPPPPQALAIHSPEGGLHSHVSTIKEVRAFWKAQLKKARQEFIPVLEDVAHRLDNRLAEGLKMWSGIREYGDSHVEYGRRLILGTLAVGLYLQRSLEDPLAMHDAIGHRYADTIIDFGGEENMNGELDFRVHLPANSRTQRYNQWYIEPPLYLHLVRPAMPTPGILEQLARRGIKADFPQLETIYPYLMR